MTPAALHLLAGLVSRHLGLFYPPHRYGDLERGFRLASADLGFTDPEYGALQLLARPLTPRQTDSLATHLTIGETHFFRHVEVFETLRQTVVPQALSTARREGRRLRIWSAGCCSGEEIYSLAILLRELGVRSNEVELLGTDVSPAALQRAREAVYSEWSFRGVPEALRSRYFESAGERRYRLRPEMRESVAFASLNLVTSTFPVNQDVVLCRNVLIYFNGDAASQVTQRLWASVHPAGWFILGACEGQLGCELGLQPWPRCPVVFAKGASREMLWPPPFESPAAPQPSLARQARAHWEAGHGPDAESLLLPLVQTGMADAETVILLARIMADRGALEQAEAVCRDGLYRHVEEPELHYLLGTIQQEQGQEEQAILSHRRALQIDRRHVMALISAGLLLRRRGQQREAQEYFHRAAGALEECPVDKPEQVAELLQFVREAGT
ncbi:MAG TPA: CheR family methyltransferase [Candidatus Xenobia bacterium]|jgi:chemotaxis protein methyltransferase CheR